MYFNHNIILGQVAATGQVLNISDAYAGKFTSAEFFQGYTFIYIFIFIIYFFIPI